MTKSRLTQAIAREYVRRLGGRLKRDTDWQEYILRFAEHDYHTDSLDDVIGTARAMQGSHPDIDQAEAYLASQGVANA